MPGEDKSFLSHNACVLVASEYCKKVINPFSCSVYFLINQPQRSISTAGSPAAIDRRRAKIESPTVLVKYSFWDVGGLLIGYFCPITGIKKSIEPAYLQKEKGASFFVGRSWC
jgi:hypothetical protein